MRRSMKSMSVKIALLAAVSGFIAADNVGAQSATTATIDTKIIFDKVLAEQQKLMNENYKNWSEKARVKEAKMKELPLHAAVDQAMPTVMMSAMMPAMKPKVKPPTMQSIIQQIRSMN